MNPLHNISITESEMWDLDTLTPPVNEQVRIECNGIHYVPCIAAGRPTLVPQFMVNEPVEGDIYRGTHDRKIRVAGRWCHLDTTGPNPKFIDCPDHN